MKIAYLPKDLQNKLTDIFPSTESRFPNHQHFKTRMQIHGLKTIKQNLHLLVFKMTNLDRKARKGRRRGGEEERRGGKRGWRKEKARRKSEDRYVTHDPQCKVINLKNWKLMVGTE